MEDHESNLNLGPGHPRKLPVVDTEDAVVPPALKNLMESEPEVAEYLKCLEKIEGGKVKKRLAEIEEETENEEETEAIVGTKSIGGGNF